MVSGGDCFDPVFQAEFALKSATLKSATLNGNTVLYVARDHIVTQCDLTGCVPYMLRLAAGEDGPDTYR